MKRVLAVLALGALAACPDPDEVTVEVTNVHGSKPVYGCVEPGCGNVHNLPSKLDKGQCNNGAVAPKPYGVAMLTGPEAAREVLPTQWPHGRYMAWSICNHGSAPTVAMTYQLLAAKDGGAPTMALEVQLAALAPCDCQPEVVLVNVPAGSEPLVTGATTYKRISVPAGDYKFSLSTPFTDFNHASAVLP